LDLLGNFLRLSPQFKGKRFLLKYWCDNPPSPHIRIAALPNGAKCRIDLRTPYEQMVWLQREEWNDLVALLDLMETGSLLIDIGANIGLWTLVGATKGEVIAVEPNPRTYQMVLAKKLPQFTRQLRPNLVRSHSIVKQSTIYLRSITPISQMCVYLQLRSTLCSPASLVRTA
jgi:hypothetical protein